MSTPPADQRPNVLLIVSDDQGPWALGAAGNPEIHTPTLDGLAREGTRFENFFCTSPVCSPARASLFTGKLPSQHGVHDWISSTQTGGQGQDFLAGQVLLSDILAGGGWRVGLSGKWHLGASDVPRQGFEHWFTHQAGGGPYYGAPVVRDTESYTEPGYLTDVIAEDAIGFLGQDDERPFFLSVCFTAPHSPWVDNHPQEYLAMYDNCAFASCPQEPDHPWLRTAGGRSVVIEDSPRASLQGYFAAVTAMDAAIGRVLAALPEDRETLVVFLSDNGFNAGHHGIWGKGNGTYPLNMYDTSVKVPAIIWRPGTVRAGHVEQALASGYDLLPSVLDHVGLAGQIPPGLPGRSFDPLLRGSADAETSQPVVVYDEYGPTRMIRTREWKLVLRGPEGPAELYHLAKDPGERINLIDDDACAGVLAELSAQLGSWFAKHVEPAFDGAHLPVAGTGQDHPLAQGHRSPFRT